MINTIFIIGKPYDSKRIIGLLLYKCMVEMLRISLIRSFSLTLIFRVPTDIYLLCILASLHFYIASPSTPCAKADLQYRYEML